MLTAEKISSSDGAIQNLNEEEKDRNDRHPKLPPAENPGHGKLESHGAQAAQVEGRSETKSRNKKETCPHCAKLFHNKSNLCRHIKSVHEGVKYPCPLCEKKFSFESALKTHIKKAHEGVNVNKYKYPCVSCGKTFFNYNFATFHTQYCIASKIKKK